jgi:hypothetical protein
MSIVKKPTLKTIRLHFRHSALITNRKLFSLLLDTIQFRNSTVILQTNCYCSANIKKLTSMFTGTETFIIAHRLQMQNSSSSGQPISVDFHHNVLCIRYYKLLQFLPCIELFSHFAQY